MRGGRAIWDGEGRTWVEGNASVADGGEEVVYVQVLSSMDTVYDISAKNGRCDVRQLRWPVLDMAKRVLYEGGSRWIVAAKRMNYCVE